MIDPARAALESSSCLDDKIELLDWFLSEEGVEASDKDSIVRGNSADDLPLSHAQRRIWILDQLEPGSHYNDYLALRVAGPLDADVLERSINDIVRRHESLRTSFLLSGEDPIQNVAASLWIPLRRIDLTDTSTANLYEEALQWTAEEIRNRFNLSAGPLLRTSLLRVDQSQHIFLLVIHQIVNDGWSLGVFVREMLSLYQAFSAGKESPLPEPPIQYGDFARWQTERLNDDYLQPQLSYWKKQLAGPLPSVQMPADRPRPAVQTFDGEKHCISIPGAIVEPLRKLANREQATLFMVFLATLKTLIFRYTGQEDILVGFPIANRKPPETEALIGMMVNTLVLRTGIEGNPTFRQLLARVRKVATDAYDNQDLPFERLVEELNPQRDLSHSPLFQVMLDYQNAPMPALDVPGLSLSRLYVDPGMAKFDLTLELWETVDGVDGWFEFNSALFNRTTVSRMAGHFKTLLEAVASDPEQRLSSLPLLTATEQRQLMVEFNSTSAEYDSSISIPEMFEAQAERTPDSVAAVYLRSSLTYAALNARANRLAHLLAEHGVGPEVLVGLCVRRSLDMIIGMLAVLKAGGAYLPLDPSYPKERLAFMVSDAGLSLLLTQDNLRTVLPDNDARVISIDSDCCSFSRYSHENLSSLAAGRNLAYVIYTSGSSGRPKGVMVERRNVANYFTGMDRVIGSEPGVWLALTSISFDMSVPELLWTLSRGFKVVIGPEIAYDSRATKQPVGELDEQNPSYDSLAELIVKHGVTHVQCTPSLATILAAEAESARALRFLRVFILGGEVLPVPLLELLREHVSGRIINGYGPTETTVYSTTHTFNGDETTVPIGRAIANTQALSLDKNLQLVPIGVPGELYVGGDGVTRGYLNRPDLTGQRFIANPFTAAGRLYKTGDLVRYTEDGVLEFLGRIDNQVKVRGYRIELGEIESVLARHTNVIEAVVDFRKDETGEQRLVAYVVTGGGEAARPTAYSLRTALQQELPAYMVPSTFVFLEQLPRTPNGKVNRSALPGPVDTPKESKASFVAPRNIVELGLAKIWEALLRVRPVGIRDNFFDLGGHSLLAVTLFSQLKKAFGKELPLTTLFQAPTVERLAPIVSGGATLEHWSSLVPIQLEGSRAPLYCIHAAGGSVLFYRDLARLLGPEQPVFGLQSRGLSGDGTVQGSVEEMASDYVKEIRAFQPEGPYRICGRCLGGYIAFEMAQQLREQGEEVELLAIVDSSPPMSKEESHDTLSRSPGFYVFRALHHLRQGQLLGVALASVASKSRRTRIEFSKSVRRLWTEIFGGSELRKLQRLERTNFEIGSRYRAQKYSGSITLIRSSEFNAMSCKDGHLRWSGLAANGFRSYVVPGHHLTIFDEPEVRGLADTLSACLLQAKSDEPNELPSNGSIGAPPVRSPVTTNSRSRAQARPLAKCGGSTAQA